MYMHATSLYGGSDIMSFPMKPYAIIIVPDKYFISVLSEKVYINGLGRGCVYDTSSLFTLICSLKQPILIVRVHSDCMQ